MVVEKVRHASAVVLEPTTEVNTVGEALETFIAWPTHQIKII